MDSLRIDSYSLSTHESMELLEATGDKQAALDLAIEQVRDRARLYVLPAVWSAEWIGRHIHVTRTRHKVSKHYVGSGPDARGGDRLVCERCGKTRGYRDMTYGRFSHFSPPGPVCLKCARDPAFIGDSGFSPSGLNVAGPKIGGR